MVPQIGAVIAGLLLAGCKGEAVPKAQANLMIFTSSVDCSSGGSLKWDECIAAIDYAVAQHESKSNKYRNLRLCEATEGTDRCERSDESTWRPKPFGYLFTLVDGRPPIALVLYAGDKNTMTFKAPDGRIFNPDQPGNVTFSRAAEKRAESFLPSRGGRRS